MKANPKRAALLICVLATIAIFIRLSYSRIEQQHTTAIAQQQHELEQEAAARKTTQEVENARVRGVQEAATEHSNYLARYLNNNVVKTPGTKLLALVAVTQDRKLDSPVSDALASRFKSDSVTISSSFFKPDFITDDLFGSVFDGSTDLINRLELSKSLDGLLLARETIKFTKNPEALDNVLTANVQLQIQVVPISGNVKNQSWTFVANGAGFSQGEALQMAQERLVKQISSDTKMSLGF